MSENVVHIRRVEGYDDPRLLPAVAEILRAEGFADAKGSILLKPNWLLGKNRNLAVTTHPRVAEAVIRGLGGDPSRIRIGDSPALPLPARTIADQLGYLDLVRRTGIRFEDFDHAPVTLRRPSNRLVKSFPICRGVAEADLVINLPKMKTHVGSIYSGAVKNLFGCVPGLEKARYHIRFPDRLHFGRMLADCAATVDADFHLMDAIVAMEGEGPSNGTPVAQNLILASRDPVALDATACRLMGLDPAAVPHLAEAAAAGLGILDPERIHLDGVASLDEIRVKTYRVRASTKEMRFGPSRLQNLLKSVLTARPAVLKDRCVRCRHCGRICPVSAISFPHDGYPVFDYDACFRCYCCHEICPEGAIVKRETLVSRLLG